MAVRHGYGKIAGTDALVFAYDTGDTINSYRGKPATNIVTTISSRGPGVTADPSDLPTVPKSVASAVYCSSKINGSTTSWESLFQYNTSFSVPDGQRFTVSAWVYVPEGKINNRFNFNCSVDGANTGLTVGSHDVPTGRWVKIHGHYLNSTGATVSVTSTRLETYTAAEWTGTSISCWAINFMIEQSADIPSGHTGSPATALGATRSVSGSLLDLTGNNSLTAANNEGYDSNAQIVYDGTDDRIITQDPQFFNNNSSDTSFSNGASYEFVIKAYGTGYFAGVGSAWRISAGSDNFTFWDRDINSGTSEYAYNIGNLSVTNNYVHVVGVLDPVNNEKRFYINGEEELNTAYDRTPSMGTTQLALGKSYPNSTAFCNCELPVGKVYTKALTAGEVKNNYSHYKKRFNI